MYIDTSTHEIYTLSLHDALPICAEAIASPALSDGQRIALAPGWSLSSWDAPRRKLANSCSSSISLCTNRTSRSEEHTSELQSHSDLVCRLLLEKKKECDYENKNI